MKGMKKSTTTKLKTTTAEATHGKYASPELISLKSIYGQPKPHQSRRLIRGENGEKVKTVYRSRSTWSSPQPKTTKKMPFSYKSGNSVLVTPPRIEGETTNRKRRGGEEVGGSVVDDMTRDCELLSLGDGAEVEGDYSLLHFANDKESLPPCPSESIDHDDHNDLTQSTASTSSLQTVRSSSSCGSNKSIRFSKLSNIRYFMKHLPSSSVDSEDVEDTKSEAIHPSRPTVIIRGDPFSKLHRANVVTLNSFLKITSVNRQSRSLSSTWQSTLRN
jgi:hypothetical protein